MKINPCSIATLNIQPKQPIFTSNQPYNAEEKQMSGIHNPIADYNVRVPISYKETGDIKLQEGLIAKSYKLANGQNVVIVPKQGSTIVKTYVNTGSFNEPDHLRGISHYIEHNLFNGSEDLGDKLFFEEVNKIGAYTNASTSFSSTNYYISSQLLDDKDLENKIMLHAGMLTSPKFLIDKLEKEKKIVNSEINMCLSENENIGATKTIKNLFNIKSTSMDLVAGNTDNITALTRQDVIDYYNNNYFPANMTTVITGEVDPDKTIALVAKYFNSTKTPQAQQKYEKLTPITKAVREDIISKKSESSAANIFLGFAGPQNCDTKENIHLKALNYLIGGIYNSKFSDIERNYGIGLNIFNERLSSRSTDPSMIFIETTVNDDKSEKVIYEIYKTINGLSQNPPTAKELSAIKNLMKKDFEMTLESSHMINNMIGHNYLNKREGGLQDYKKIIDEMTPQDIQKVAQKYLDLNKAALTVVHPKGTSETQIKERFDNNKNSQISFSGAIKKTPINENEIKTYRANNNYEIILNNSNSDVIQYKYTIALKEWNSKKAAAADVLSDILKNAGTLNDSAENIAKKSDDLGISSYTYANEYGIYLSGDFPTSNTKEALDMFSQKVLSPNISEKEVQDAIKRLKDKFSNIETNPYEKFNAKIYEGTPIAYTTKEIINALDSITPHDVKELYSEIFKNGQGKIVISAPFKNNPELKNIIFEEISKYPNVKTWNNELQKIYKPTEKTEVFTDYNLKNQADILLGYRYKTNGNMKDSICTDLLDIILGGSSSSRLFSDLREKRHLAYAVSSSHQTVDDLGVFTLKIGTTTENKETGEKTFDNVQKSIRGFIDNIQKITTEKVSDEELELAKKKLKSSILNQLETTGGRTTTINEEFDSQYGIGFTNKIYNLIDTITADDILNTANNIFNSKPIYSVTGTIDTINANKEFFESLKQ